MTKFRPIQVELHGGPLHGRVIECSPDAFARGALIVPVALPPVRELSASTGETIEPAARTVKYTRVRGSTCDFEFVAW